jgi:hypothetical protein
VKGAWYAGMGQCSELEFQTTFCCAWLAGYKASTSIDGG